MKKLVFVSFAIFMGIHENAYGMFNAQDRVQSENNQTSLIRAELPANENNNQIENLAAQISRLTTLVETSLANEKREAEEKNSSSVYNYQIGDLKTQISGLTTLAETSLANEKRKEEEKNNSSVYNYQIGDLRGQISGLTTLVETSLANEKRKDEEKNNSSAYNYQIGDLKTQISQLTTLVQNLNEKMTILSEEKESLIAKSSAERKEEAKSEQHQAEESEINQQAKESNSDKLAVNREKNSSNVSAVVDVNSVTAVNAKKVIEEMLTELLRVAGEQAVQARQQEFSNLVKSNRAKGWKVAWVNSTNIKIENNIVKFEDPGAVAHRLGLDRVKNFLRDVQTQINAAKRKEMQEEDGASRVNTNSTVFSMEDLSGLNASAVVNVDTINKNNAKSAIEGMLTELLHVAGKQAVQARQQEFSNLVRANRAKGWKAAWMNSTEIKIENNTVKFKDPGAVAYGLGLDRIKDFLADVQRQINMDKKTKS